MRALIWVLVLAGCKGEARPQAVAGEAGVATHVRLPKARDGAVRRTSAPLGRERLERMAAIEHADFERQARSGTATSVEFRHMTTTRPLLGVTVEIGACGACEDVTTTPAEVRAGLPAALRERADTRVAVAPREVGGVTAVATYKLGAAFGQDEHGQPAGDYVDAYALDYNDGVNRIRVTASYLDDAVGGVAQLQAVAPREDLEKMAAAFLGFYLHEWQ